MVGLVETIMKLHKDLPKAKPPHEQESIQRQIAATDRQFDAPTGQVRLNGYLTCSLSWISSRAIPYTRMIIGGMDV